MIIYKGRRYNKPKKARKRKESPTPEITILRPDYYGRFACKCGACRATCCSGWPVSLSRSEYFRLLGLDVPPELRRRLDGALRLAEAPLPERYACMEEDERGCRLLTEEGLCSLQLACGESAPPEVCRLFPRAVHMGQCPEVCLSAGCERTVELLTGEKLSFGTITARFDGVLPPKEPPERTSLRMRCIGILQASAFGLSERIRAAGEAAGAALPPIPEDSAAFRETAAALFAQLSRHSPALRRCRMPESGDPPVPEWVYENLMLNHAFYMRFPYACGPDREARTDAAFALMAAYLLLRTLTAGAAGPEAFTDAAAQVFRCAEHSDFYPDAGRLLRRLTAEH